MKIKTTRHTIHSGDLTGGHPIELHAGDDISTTEIVRVEFSTDDESVTVHIDINPATVLLAALGFIARLSESTATTRSHLTKAPTVR